MKKQRGAYRISRKTLARRLGMSPWLYGVELEAATGDVVFYCYVTQDRHEVPDGNHAPQVRIEDPRF